MNYYRTWAEVDLSVIRENVIHAKQVIPDHMKFCGVIKTDAYGHGAPAVAWALRDLCDMFAVATLDEGIILRDHGVEKPILCLGVIDARDYERMIRHRIMPTIFTVKQAALLEEAVLKAGTADFDITIALDTGMGRIGIVTEDADALETAKTIAGMPHLRLLTVFSHFARADETDKAFALLQLERFTRFTEAMKAAGIQIPIRHIANSAGIIEGIGHEFDMVRDGISIYGVLPSNEVSTVRVPLRQAISWRANVTHVKKVPAGTTVSYGSTFVSDQPMEIATVGLGYGDGLPRRLSNQGQVIIRGRKRPILGRVCMDQFMIDVTGLGAEPGDTVTVLGRDGDEEITVYDWEAFQLFTYEVLCDIGKRVPRVYYLDGREVGTHDACDEHYADFDMTAAKH